MVILIGAVAALIRLRPQGPGDEPPRTSLGAIITSTSELEGIDTRGIEAAISLGSDSSTVRVSQKLHCSATFKTKTTMHVPTHFNVVFRKRSLDHAHQGLNIIRDEEGGGHLLGATIRAPSEPGSYQLVLECDYLSTVLPGRPGFRVVPSTPYNVLTVDIPGPRVQVRR